MSRDFRNFVLGIGMIFIFLFHVATMSESSAVEAKLFSFLFSYFDWGVNLFFLLSTYGLCFSLSNNTIRTFYRRRIVRIYPLYVLFLAIIYLSKSQDLYSIGGGIILNITGFSLFFDNIVHAWYIPATILLYLIFPLLYRAIKWFYIRKNYFLLLFLIVGSLVLSSIVNGYYISIALCRIPYMFIGILLYMSDKNDDYRYLMNCSLALSILGLVMFPVKSYLTLLFPIVFFLRFYRNISNSRMVCRVGKYSLEIFFAQGLSLGWFINYTDNFIINLLLVLTSTFFLSYSFAFYNKLFCQ